MSENSNGNGICKMYPSSVVDWQNEVAAVAGPYQSGDTRESWLYRAARKSGLSLRAIKSLWYGESKDPRFSVARSIIQAAEKARQEAIKQAGEYENLAARMSHTDPDFHSQDVLALLHAARSLRGSDRP
jgi:hypothetical protein